MPAASTNQRTPLFNCENCEKLGFNTPLTYRKYDSKLLGA